MAEPALADDDKTLGKYTSGILQCVVHVGWIKAVVLVIGKMRVMRVERNAGDTAASRDRATAASPYAHTVDNQARRSRRMDRHNGASLSAYAC